MPATMTLLWKVPTFILVILVLAPATRAQSNSTATGPSPEGRELRITSFTEDGIRILPDHPTPDTLTIAGPHFRAYLADDAEVRISFLDGGCIAARYDRSLGKLVYEGDLLVEVLTQDGPDDRYALRDATVVYGLFDDRRAGFVNEQGQSL